MRDIEQLRQQVESAERNISSSELARNRECEALMEMWREIRARFEHQGQEIARYRTQVDTLIRKNDELGRLVDSLIASIEGSVNRSRDETVPRITALAEELLASEPSADELAEITAALTDTPAATADQGFDPEEAETARSDEDSEDGLDGDDELHLDDYIDDEDDDIDDGDDDAPGSWAPAIDRSSAPSPDFRTHLDPPADDNPVGETMSPGIQNLISRIEGAVDRSPASQEAEESGAGANASTDDDDQLTRELREIETLRNELSGLRDRISSGSSQ